MSIVYITQESMRIDPLRGLQPAVDHSPAEKFGTLQFLLPWSLFKDPTTVRMDAVVEKLYEDLRHFGNDDYLLMVGNPTAMALAAMVASDINDGKANLLYWDRVKREYTCVSVDLGWDK